MPILVIRIDKEAVISFLLRDFALANHCTCHVSSLGFIPFEQSASIGEDKTEIVTVTTDNVIQYVIRTFPSLQEAHNYRTKLTNSKTQFVVLPSDLKGIKWSEGTNITTLTLPTAQHLREYLQDNKKIFQPLFISWIAGYEVSPEEFKTRGSSRSYIPDISPTRVSVWSDVPGVTLINNFISSEEEKRIMASIDAMDWELNLKRRVQHFGYKFKYSSLNIDPSGEGVAAIPHFLEFVQDRFVQNGLANTKADQLTVNEYLPGQGIGHHVDTHSAFKESIFILNLNSHIGFEFRQKQPDNAPTIVREYFLRPQSLCIMSGEARYGWLHGITSRKTDVDPDSQKVTPRGRRISLTFRWLNWDSKFQCLDCQHPSLCDTRNPASLVLPTRLKE